MIRYIFFAGVIIGSTAHSSAVTLVSPSDPNSIPGVNDFAYDTYFVMGDDHEANWQDDTDAYSWDHPDLAAMDPELTGWTHLSRWIAFTLTTPAQVTIRVEQTDGVMIPDQNNPGEFIGAGGDLVPAFTLWSGIEPDAVMTGGHRWDNDGDGTPWITGLSYRSHDGNLGNATFVEQTLNLGAGEYTMNISGAKDGPLDTAGGLRKGFDATLTTAPIPEPSALALLAVFGLSMLGRRNR